MGGSAPDHGYGAETFRSRLALKGADTRPSSGFDQLRPAGCRRPSPACPPSAHPVRDRLGDALVGARGLPGVREPPSSAQVRDRPTHSGPGRREGHMLWEPVFAAHHMEGRTPTMGPAAKGSPARAPAEGHRGREFRGAAPFGWRATLLGSAGSRTVSTPRSWRSTPSSGGRRASRPERFSEPGSTRGGARPWRGAGPLG